MEENRPKTTASKKTDQARASNPFGNNKTSTAKKVATGAAVAGGAFALGRKASKKAILIAIVSFILALALGAGVCFFLGRNDNFTIIGSDELMLTLGETYQDEGVSIKEFGFDLSKNAIVNTNLKTDTDGNYYADDIGTYYIAYTVNSLKFGFVYHVQKVRLITFVEASEGGE